VGGGDLSSVVCRGGLEYLDGAVGTDLVAPPVDGEGQRGYAVLVSKTHLLCKPETLIGETSF
jgi:hypothetical protein